MLIETLIAQENCTIVSSFTRNLVCKLYSMLGSYNKIKIIRNVTFVSNRYGHQTAHFLLCLTSF